jgi:hypothetical protein
MSGRLLTAVVVAAIAGSVILNADDLSVTFDPNVNFSGFRTYAVGASTVDSERPELDNPLFVKYLAEAVRAGFARRGLTESASRPDVFVEMHVENGEIRTSQRGTPLPGPGQRGRSSGPRPLRYTDATLVVDLKRAGDTSPIWHGVYHTDEGSGADLVKALPEGVKKLLGRYPPRR